MGARPLWAAKDSTGEQHPDATMGRSVELAAVAELVSTTAAGVGRVMLVEGEAGIGKSHLVRQATAQARRAGIAIVEMSADELVRRPGLLAHELAYSVRTRQESGARLDELLDAARRPADAGEDLSYAVIEAGVDLLEEMARTQPVLVAAEDLQWADDLSLRMLAAIVQRVGVSRFSVVGSLRPSPHPAALDRMVERVHYGLGAHVRLGPLDDADVHALASSLTGATPGEGLCERLRTAAGNPLFVTELLRCLDDDGVLRTDAGVIDVAVDVTPANLYETLVRRLSWLPRETNELLRLASLLGSAFTLHDLAAITGRSVVDVAAWLREASVAGLVVGDGDRLSFRHDLIREAVYGHMLAAERRDLHRAAGEALAHADAPTQQIAQQYARGALPGDLEAVMWLERAALETISVSPSSAIELLDEAVSLTPAQWPGRAAIQVRMIEPLTWCGRFGDAEAIANMILAASPDAGVEFAALRGLSAVHGHRGDMAAAIATLHRAASIPGAPDGEARQLRCVAAQMSMLTGTASIDVTRQVADETMAKAVTEGDATTQCLAHQTLGVIASVTGYGVVAREHLSAAVGLFDSGRVTQASFLIPDTYHAVGLLELDAVDDALKAADEARKRVEQRGALALAPMAYIVAAGAHFYGGRWDDAIAEIEAGLAVIDDTGNLNFVLYYEAIRAKIAIHRGDLATAQARLTAGTQRLAGGVSLFGADWLFGTQAEFLAANGELDAALTVAETTWAHTASIRYFYGYRSRGTFLVRHAVAAGRDELASAVTGDLEEGARRTPASSAAGAALMCRGLVRRDPDLLLEAAARYRETQLLPDLAACCEDAAGLLAASGRREEAITLLHEAATIHGELDAGADAARVDAALRDLGVRHASARVRRPSFGWESLTPMESEVSQLVAEGLTNPEIGARLYISRRTVETHLSHVFRKLSLASRTHLTAELFKRTLSAPGQ